MTIGFDVCSERIIGIALNRFHNIELWCTCLLVSIEDDVVSIRNVIRIHGHSLKIMRTINHDSNLSVMSRAQVKIFYARTNLDNAIFVGSCVSSRSFITVFDLYSFRIDRSRILSLVPTASIVNSSVISDALDHRGVFVNITSGDILVMQDLNRRAVLRICRLGNTDSLNNISFRL